MRNRYGAGSMVVMTDANKTDAKTWIASNIGAYGGTAFAAPLLTATGILKKQQVSVPLTCVHWGALGVRVYRLSNLAGCPFGGHLDNS